MKFSMVWKYNKLISWCYQLTRCIIYYSGYFGMDTNRQNSLTCKVDAPILYVLWFHLSNTSPKDAAFSIPNIYLMERLGVFQVLTAWKIYREIIHGSKTTVVTQPLSSRCPFLDFAVQILPSREFLAWISVKDRISSLLPLLQLKSSLRLDPLACHTLHCVHTQIANYSHSKVRFST